eukprot:2291685-Prymnesium_polylepis.1
MRRRRLGTVQLHGCGEAHVRALHPLQRNVPRLLVTGASVYTSCLLLGGSSAIVAGCGSPSMAGARSTRSRP